MRKSILLFVLGVLAASAQPYEHVVVTADSMVDAFAPLGNHIENRLGMNDTVVAIEDICVSFPGRDDPEKLRNFIRYAYQNWGTTHVLLGGDDDVVPVRFAWGRVWWAGITMLIPCDLYYACLDGDWDANQNNVFGEAADSVDLLPEVFIGRAPVTYRSAAAWFVDKTLAYSTDSAAPYLRNVLLAGFDIDDSTHGETTMELYDSAYVPEAMRPCIKVYDSHAGNHKDDMLAALNDGQHLVVHWDHSHYYAYGCGWRNHGWYITQMEMYRLSNGSQYSIVMSGGCYTGRFDTLECIIEYALAAPNGGAVAAVGNTRYGLYGRDAGQNPQRTLTALQMERVMATMLAPGRPASLEDFTLAKASLAPLADTSEPDRWCIYTFTLFGEPCMPVWIPGQSGVVERTEAGGTKAGHGALGSSFVRNVLVLNAETDALLSDVTGREVMQLNPGGNDLGHVPPGVYFVRAGDASGRTLGKIVKVRKE